MQDSLCAPVGSVYKRPCVHANSWTPYATDIEWGVWKGWKQGVPREIEKWKMIRSVNWL